ncbi:MAG: polysaccharide biosynthesis protein [Thermoguttaceae bacterium]
MNPDSPQMDAASLSSLATGRSASLFAGDVDSRREELRRRIGGSRILIVGGSGSIGAATTAAVAAYRPESLHVVDQNENTLVELVRTLRSDPAGLAVPDFRCLPIDFGSTIMERMLRESPPYDYVLNFAALKHVRSEKDVCSLLQMLNTNLIKQTWLLCWLAEKGGLKRYFCVSTDKAANPVNLMGASKRAMEHVVFSGETCPSLTAETVSARFANVAFSDGSLLDGFLKRLQKRQPLAVPRQTRRYFISLVEAGQICLLAAFCAPHRHTVVPRLDPAADLHDLQDVAEAVLRRAGFAPAIYHDEAEARTRVPADMKAGRYPLLLAPLDTSGEKPYEEFLGENETAVEIGMSQLLAIPYVPAPRGTVATLIEELERYVANARVPADKAAIVARLAAAVPQFHHVETGKTLDQRM